MPNVTDVCIAAFEKMVLGDLEVLESTTKKVRHDISKEEFRSLKLWLRTRRLLLNPLTKASDPRHRNLQTRSRKTTL